MRESDRDRVTRAALLSDGLQQVVRWGNEFGDRFFLSLLQQYPQTAARFTYIDRETRQAALWRVMSRIAGAAAAAAATEPVQLLDASDAADGVQPEDYRVFATVLLERMRAFEGEGFTAAMAEVWSEVLIETSFGESDMTDSARAS